MGQTSAALEKLLVQADAAVFLSQVELSFLLQKALITGADSGIGRAVALAYAREGADVAIAYLNEHKDAEVCFCLFWKSPSYTHDACMGCQV